MSYLRKSGVNISFAPPPWLESVRDFALHRGCPPYYCDHLLKSSRIYLRCWRSPNLGELRGCSRGVVRLRRSWQSHQSIGPGGNCVHHYIGEYFAPGNRRPRALSEVTGGARIAGAFLGDFDYDVEMNKQTGSLGVYSMNAWPGHWNAGCTFKNRTHPTQSFR